MKTLQRWRRAALLGMPGLLCAAGLAHAAAPVRVVGLGGPVTEIVYALDAGASMVGADASSSTRRRRSSCPRWATTAPFPSRAWPA